MEALFLYALGWISFAVAHSSLARQSFQKRFERYLRGAYRLIYNVLSVIHIVALLSLGKYYLDTRPFHILNSSLVATALLMIKVAGLLIIVVSLTKYDLGRFSGFTQLQTMESLGDTSREPLQIKGLNSWVRHPLYSGAFLYLWGGSGSSYGLWTAIFGSLYLYVGSVLEERKLVEYYGSSYMAYQQKVPRFVPSKRQGI